MNDKKKKMIRYGIILFVILGLVILGIGLNLDQGEEVNEEKKKIYEIIVEVKGEVYNPSVYRLPEGSRVSDLIAIAGGFTNNADDKNINLAARLEDGMIILVNKIEETLGKININQATYEELMTLEGMTKTRANNIIEYREENGTFNSINELVSRKLITDEIFEKIKEFITV